MNRFGEVHKSHNAQRNPGISTAALWLVILVQTVFLVSGCAKNPSATFRNPQFRCPSSGVVERDEGYPYPVRQYPQETHPTTIAELKDFCVRMKQRFANSNMTVKEAENVYALLKETNGKSLPDGHVLIFHNETYGMPGPEQPKPFVFEKQVMLRKITTEKYEIFYHFVGCGHNYLVEEIRIENGEITGDTLVEGWRELYPC
jgi:hypothetical protein